MRMLDALEPGPTRFHAHDGVCAPWRAVIQARDMCCGIARTSESDSRLTHVAVRRTGACRADFS